MIQQKAPPIVALIQKQSYRVAFAEAEFITDAILLNLESIRGRLPQDQLRRSGIYISCTNSSA